MCSCSGWKKISELGRASTDFVKHLIPTPQAPRPETIAAILRLILPALQPVIVRAIISSRPLDPGGGGNPGPRGRQRIGPQRT